MPLLVVKGSGQSLFGTNWLSRIKLDWKKICSIRVSDTGLPQDFKTQWHITVQCHSNVFKLGLCTMKGVTAKLEMKPDTQTKFCKACQVPYVLQEAVDAEYYRLESSIVEKVELSKWATPMVHVPKYFGQFGVQFQRQETGCLHSSAAETCKILSSLVFFLYCNGSLDKASELATSADGLNSIVLVRWEE